MNKSNLRLMTMLAAGSLLLGSCSGGNDKGESTHDHHDSMEHEHTTGEMTKSSTESHPHETNGDVSPILHSYIMLKDELVKDDAKAAAIASAQLHTDLKALSTTNLLEDDLNEVIDILESAVENAEHISQNAGDIHHQREHFISLSVDIKDLVQIIGTTEKLYEDYCPMANNNEGAIWLSDKEEIYNPYMGSRMPRCGKINQVIEPNEKGS